MPLDPIKGPKHFSCSCAARKSFGPYRSPEQFILVPALGLKAQLRGAEGAREEINLKELRSVLYLEALHVKPQLVEGGLTKLWGGSLNFWLQERGQVKYFYVKRGGSDEF